MRFKEVLFFLVALYFLQPTNASNFTKGSETNWTSPTPDRDFPGWNVTLETLSSCSYIIPMDYRYQGCGNLTTDPELGIIGTACDVCDPPNVRLFNNPDFNLYSYGLVNTLLWSDIPVKWIIKTGKAHNDYDIEDVPTILIYPSRLAIANETEALTYVKNRSFAGGPFAIATVFTEFADPFITNYTMTVGEVRVFMIRASIIVDVRYTLLTRPYVAMLASSGEQFILEAVLLSAGFQRGLHYDQMTKQEARDKLGNGTCITMAMEPHFHACQDHDTVANFTDNNAAFVSAARAVLELGSNFYAMCGGIMTYEQCDNEDGTVCRECASATTSSVVASVCSAKVEPGYGLQCNMTGIKTFTNKYFAAPCLGADDMIGNCTPINVRAIPFGGFRGGSLCTSYQDGYTHGRLNPPVPGYCPQGYFMTENVNNSSMGGFNAPPAFAIHPLNNLVNPQYYNIAPDIPFNQWEGDWEYESSSSVQYMTLWHKIADGVKDWQQTKLREENWAHFTISEENNKRDIATNYTGYPYGIYYAAHAKLKKFQGGQGGNIFYLAGHHYACDNVVNAGAGYLMMNHSGLGTLQGVFMGSDCVDAGVKTIFNGTMYLTGPATNRGGGCFARQGRRMLLNAILTPSNLTCNVPRTICGADNKCTVEVVQLNVDPCAKYGICGSSMFKRSVETCAPPLKCSCDERLDCCGICGGNGSSCIVIIKVNDTTDSAGGMNGKSVGSKVDITINNKTISSLQGDVAPAVNPPQPPISLNAAPLSVAEVIAILAVWDKWPTMPNGATFDVEDSDTMAGILIMNVNGNLGDPTAIRTVLLGAIEQSTGIDMNRVVVSVDAATNEVVITVFPPGVTAPTAAPTHTQNPSTPSTSPLSPSSPSVPSTPINVTNMTGDTPSRKGLNINPGSCAEFMFIVGVNVETVNMYAAIQTQITAYSPMTLQLFLKKGERASKTLYDCKSPSITDNHEYQFAWSLKNTENGTWIGKSSTIVAASCQNNFVLLGTWYASLCNVGTNEGQFSFQVTLISFLFQPPVQDIAPLSGGVCHLEMMYLLMLVILVLLGVVSCKN